MKLVKYFLSVVVVLNSAVSAAGPKEEAQKSIDQSHVAARMSARSLLQRDLSYMTASILNSPSTHCRPSTTEIPQLIRNLNAKVLAQIERPFSVATMDIRQLNELVQAYESLVRERFQASFQVQNLVYERQMNLYAFELPFKGFAAMCKTGRSGKNVIGDPGTLPRIPPSQYSFTVSYGTDGHSMSASANGPDSGAEERNKISNILGTSAGIASSIALSGGAGASVAMAMTVAPWLAGAFVAYAAFNFAVTNQNAIKLENEATEAQDNLFHKAATDRDVANYYREACEEALKTMEPLYKTVREFYESDERRQQIALEITSSREARRVYVAEAAVLNPHRPLMNLSLSVRGGECEEAKSVTPKSEAPCTKVGTVYTLKDDPTVKLDTASKKDMDLIEELKPKFKAFNEKYPQELAIQYQAHNALETIYINWQEVSETLVSSSFAGVDQAMSLLSHKVRHFVLEVQKVQNSSWAKSIRLIDTEEKLQRQYFELRSEYFQLLANSIKILFNKADANQGKEQFKRFAKKFDSFASLTIKNPDVREMNQAVQSLKRFYETL